MILKFCPAEHLVLIFIKRILPTPEIFELCKGQVISQTNAIPQFILNQRWIWWDSFLNGIREHVQMARQINSGGGIYYGSLKLKSLININPTRDLV